MLVGMFNRISATEGGVVTGLELAMFVVDALPK